MRPGPAAFLGGLLGAALQRLVTRLVALLARYTLAGVLLLAGLLVHWWQTHPGRVVLGVLVALFLITTWLSRRKLARYRVRRRVVPGQREPIPGWLRQQIIDRDGGRCGICGFPCTDPARIHIDHIHPVHAGGTNDPDNLQTAHDDCNLRKGGMVGWQPPYRRTA